MIGSNIRKLVCERMSQLMIPKGGGILDALNVLSNKDQLSAIAKEAAVWVDEVIALVKTAPDNPYKTDEEIAGAILEKFEEAKRGRS